MRTPRLTFVSEGKPRRLLLIISKKGLILIELVRLVSHFISPVSDELLGDTNAGIVVQSVEQRERGLLQNM